MKKKSTQIKLTLAVFGALLVPDKVTGLIKISPTNCWMKGDSIPMQQNLTRKDNKVHVRKESAWEYSIGFIKTFDIDVLLDQFEKVFESKKHLLKEYVFENKLDISLNIVVEIADEEAPSIHFNKRIVKLCNDLEVEIDIDIYMVNND
jgi:hypothetical protein